MGCITREKYGTCNHAQCPFPQETPHGYECIDIEAYKGELFCEVGEGCLEKCPYSWQPNTPKAELNKQWNKEFTERLNKEMEEFNNKQTFTNDNDND
jgi:hypothetical protein